MNDVLENQLSMFQKVQAHNVLHAAEMITIPSIATLHTEFNGYITTILNTAGAASADITGYTVDKQNKRVEFTNAILKISTAYAAWAYVNGNIKAAERFDNTPAALNALRDNDLYTYAQDLNATATLVTAAILPFGAAATDFTILTTKAAEFLALIQAPKTQIGERASKLEAVTMVFNKANDLLKIRLDNVMKVFIVSNPTLYNSYLYARSIDDTGSPSLPDYTGNIAANSIVEIANIPYVSSRYFKIKNTGTVPIIFALSNVNNIIQGSAINVPPAASITRQSNTLNTDIGANFLLLQNQEPLLGGSYEITIEE